MHKNMLTRDALGVDENYKLSNAEVDDLRNSFLGITPFIILFTARSGSTFLTHEVTNARVLSSPDEWFSWLYIKNDMERNGGNPVDFIKRLISEKKSAQGIFGVEANSLMLELFEDIIPLDILFPRKPRWFFLRRRNLVAQSISNFLADESRVFHSYQLDGSNAQKVQEVTYDGDKLRSYIRNFISEEVKCMDRFKRSNVSPVHLFYEDVVRDPHDAVKLISNVLGIHLPVEYLKGETENAIKKLAGNKNSEFEARFRSEEKEFLEEMLSLRPEVLAQSTTV